MTLTDCLVYDAPFFSPNNACYKRLQSSEGADRLGQAARRSLLLQRSVQ